MSSELVPTATGSDERPTEPSEVLLPLESLIVPRAAKVPVFPDEWVELVDDIRQARRAGLGEGIFSPAPVLRQSFATLCEKLGRSSVA